MAFDRPDQEPETTVSVQCPHCFETVEIWIDPTERGEMVQDCEVCCRPWTLTVHRDADGTPRVRVDPA